MKKKENTHGPSPKRMLSFIASMHTQKGDRD